MRGFFGRIKRYGALVMFSHSIFSASFAVASAIFASRGIPPFENFIWIMIAFTGARTFANAVNRIIDRKIDAENPRTAGRHIPAGSVSIHEARVLAAVFFILFIAAAAMLPPVCLALTPVAGILMLLYSYTKRFTWLCHFFLGATCACASFGGWLGITGRFELEMLPIAAANGAWVTGFDMIYAVQDMEHDRKAGLYSFPARFGRKAALTAAILLHTASLFLLVSEGVIMGSSVVYFTGMAVIGSLFVFQHAHTFATAFRNVDFASYSVSKAVGLTLLAASAGDLLFRFWQGRI